MTSNSLISCFILKNKNNILRQNDKHSLYEWRIEDLLTKGTKKGQNNLAKEREFFKCFA